MAAPGPLAAWVGGGTFCCARLFASSRGRLGTHLGCYACCPLAAGRHRGAALVARGVVGLGCAERARLLVQLPEQTRCGLPVARHGRRSLSNLRRPPQEVAASCPCKGTRKHGRSGATVGEPRPSATNKKSFPGGEGVTAIAVTDRGSPACSASRCARCAPWPLQARRALRAPCLRPMTIPPNESPESRRLFGEGLGREAPASPTFHACSA